MNARREYRGSNSDYQSTYACSAQSLLQPFTDTFTWSLHRGMDDPEATVRGVGIHSARGAHIAASWVMSWTTG